MPFLVGVIDWPTAAAMIGVVAPLVAVWLTLVTFHLRTLREHQAARHHELARRIEVLDGAVGSARQALSEMQRDYATKEEWLRESMAARQHLERLVAVVTRLETEIEGRRGRPRYLETQRGTARETPGVPDGTAGRPNRGEQS